MTIRMVRMLSTQILNISAGVFIATGVFNAGLHFNGFFISLVSGKSMQPLISGSFSNERALKENEIKLPIFIKKDPLTFKTPTLNFFRNALKVDLLLVKKLDPISPETKTEADNIEGSIRFSNGRAKRGDVLFCHYREKDIIKRLVGIENDIIQIIPKIYVKSNEINETQRFYTVVPKSHVYLQGDNLANSMDSRTYGEVPVPLVLGKGVFKLWPPNEHFGRIQNTLEHSKGVLKGSEDELEQDLTHIFNLFDGSKYVVPAGSEETTLTFGKIRKEIENSYVIK